MDGGVLGTILGGVLGFLASVLPEVFRLLGDYLNGRKSGPVVEGEVSAEAAARTLDVDDEDTPPAREADTPLSYVILDFLRSSVRPIVTYAFFGVFIYIKMVLLYHALIVDQTKAIDLLPILWDEGTEALFAAVLSFWFGSRAMARFKRK